MGTPITNIGELVAHAQGAGAPAGASGSGDPRAHGLTAGLWPGELVAKRVPTG